MKFSAVVLAGGRSRRMGRDKAWLPVEGRSLLEHQIGLATALGALEVFISGRSGVEYPAGFPVLLDLKPDQGPLGGIERALAVASQSIVLVLAVDLPHVGDELLPMLLAECADGIGAVPMKEERFEPMVAFYPKLAHSIAADRLRREELKVSDFAAECCRRGLTRIARVSSGSRGFINWNGPEDVSRTQE